MSAPVTEARSNDLEETPVAGEGAPTTSAAPSNNLKRSDPFQFGTRFLTQEDDVFAFNAWDHVEVDDEFKKFAEQQYEMQRQSPVSDFDKGK